VGCGKKASTLLEWIKIFTGCQQHIAITNTITIATNNKSPHHHISTLHTSHTNTNHIAIMGNGAKAASKRERNAKDAGSVAKSQLKSVRFFPLLLPHRWK
jgi:hypothetical protein